MSFKVKTIEFTGAETNLIRGRVLHILLECGLKEGAAFKDENKVDDIVRGSLKEIAYLGTTNFLHAGTSRYVVYPLTFIAKGESALLAQCKKPKLLTILLAKA